MPDIFDQVQSDIFDQVSSGMSEKDFTKARQAAAINEPAFKKLAAATIPTAAGIASLAIPGSGLIPLAAQGALGAGSTYLNQKLGFEPESPMEVFKAGAIPFAAQGAISGVKGLYKAAGKALIPGPTRTAGVEAGLQKLGATPNAITRAYETPASKQAYKIAEGQPPLSAKAITETIESVAEETGKAIPNRPALRQLRETVKNIIPPIKVPEVQGATNIQAFVANKQKAANELLEQLRNQPTEVGYKELMNEVNGLRTQAAMAFEKRNGVAGTTLNKAASAILDKMDEVSPEIKRANALYRREQSVEKISKVLSNPRPDVKLGDLFLKDPLVKGIIPIKDARFLENIARQIQSIGTVASPYGGLGAKTLNFITTPIAAAMTSPLGRTLMRQTFKDGKVTMAGLAVVGQFMRAYEASGAAEQE